MEGHCIGKQWKFRKGIKKNQMHFNKCSLDLGLSKLSIMKWLQLARGCLLLIFLFSGGLPQIALLLLLQLSFIPFCSYFKWETFLFIVS